MCNIYTTTYASSSSPISPKKSRFCSLFPLSIWNNSSDMVSLSPNSARNIAQTYRTNNSLCRTFSNSSLLVLLTAIFVLNCCLVPVLCVTGNPVYTNQWAVKLGDVTPTTANQVAAKHGFVNMGEILPGYYLFTHPLVSKRSTRQKRNVQIDLFEDPLVSWAEQQVAKVRVKRDVSINENQAKFRAYRSAPNDPQWNDMWYLNRPNLDMGVQIAWELGVTGRDIVVTILDDGLEYTHPDIAENYDPQASYDINDHDSDPTPRYDYTNENRHGTRCAGEVAARFNNNICVVGIAFNAKIGGVRMLDGDVTDAVEARALSQNRQHIDIYSASWGPEDDGRTVDGPARLARAAFQEGIEMGRGGKGSIFVWASGNGGRDADSCSCDGYTNSIYVISVSSATEGGYVPWYSEPCSSTLAATYSSGANGERMIVTTDLHGGCTPGHTGTSASAPIAAAICALALEANPNLTWRDMQHIVVRTARPEALRTNDWMINGVGRNVSHSFGFGLMDAGSMVKLARNWTLVPQQRLCFVPYPDPYNAAMQIPQKSKLQVELESDGCADDAVHRVNYVEHVQAKITLSALRRGEIQIFLISPMGTRATLLPKRSRDLSRQGFKDWTFMSTHSWGERSQGTWILEIQNDGWQNATLGRWDLQLYGTEAPVGPFGGAGSPAGFFSMPKNCQRMSEQLALCIECEPNYVLYRHECLNSCPPLYFATELSDTFINQNYNGCAICAWGCRSCIGPAKNQCTACAENYELTRESTCVLTIEHSDDFTRTFESSAETAFAGTSRNRTSSKYPMDKVGYHPIFYGIICGAVVLALAILSISLIMLKPRIRRCLKNRKSRAREEGGSNPNNAESVPSRDGASYRVHYSQRYGMQAVVEGPSNQVARSADASANHAQDTASSTCIASSGSGSSNNHKMLVVDNVTTT